MTLPNGSTVDSAAMLAMLQTLFTAAAGSAPPNASNGASPEAAADNAENQARQIVNTLGASIPLLPGINLFNPAQAKALQQQMASQNAASAQAFPLAKLRAKARPSALNLHSSRGSTSSNGNPMSDGNTDMEGFSFPGKPNLGSSKNGRPQMNSNRSAIASSSTHPASEPIHRNSQMYPTSHQQYQQQQHHQPVRLKFWAQGCLKCHKTERVGWRVKQTRKKALDGTILEPGMLHEDGQISKLCEGKS